MWQAIRVRVTDTEIRRIVAGFVVGALATLLIPAVQDFVLTVLMGGGLALGALIQAVTPL